MKIVHTFLPITPPRINKQTIYHMTLSVLLAKKFYDNVVLYTNVETAEIVKKIGLPYNEINTKLLEGVETHTFSIPKLIVYAAQKEPFIHIDLDTFLFKKIEFNDIYSIYSSYNEGLNEIIKVSNEGLGFFNTYIKNTFEIKDKLPEDFILNIDFSEIPNMSIFGGYNYDIITRASKYCLDLYYDNRDHFDKYYYNACIIEQLFIPSAIRLFNMKKYEKVNFAYVYKKENPTQITFLPDNEWNYPFEIKSNGEKIVIEDDIDLYSRISYNFNGFLHLCGSKYYDKILYLLRSKIIFDFKESSYIRKINELFPEVLDFEKDLDHYEEMKKIFNKKKSII